MALVEPLVGGQRRMKNSPLHTLQTALFTLCVSVPVWMSVYRYIYAGPGGLIPSSLLPPYLTGTPAPF